MATGNRKLYLTLLGGGAFGNDTTWILAAIRRSRVLFQSFDLDVRLVSRRQRNPPPPAATHRQSLIS